MPFLKTLFVSLIAIEFFFINLSAQEKEHQFIDSSNNLLSKGIFLENKNLMIPWDMEFGEIDKRGNPTIVNVSKRMKRVTWDSVTIFDGIKVSLRYFPFKTFFGRGKYSRLTTMYGTIDSAHFQNVKDFFERSTGSPGKLIETKYRITYNWVINNCGVRTGYWKENKKKKITTIFFLDFQHTEL